MFSCHVTCWISFRQLNHWKVRAYFDGLTGHGVTLSWWGVISVSPVGWGRLWRRCNTCRVDPWNSFTTIGVFSQLAAWQKLVGGRQAFPIGKSPLFKLRECMMLFVFQCWLKTRVLESLPRFLRRVDFFPWKVNKHLGWFRVYIHIFGILVPNYCYKCL